MNIELTDDEVVALLEVLTHRLTDLRVEIRHTDSPTFRAGLLQRRELLRRVQAVLESRAESLPAD